MRRALGAVLVNGLLVLLPFALLEGAFRLLPVAALPPILPVSEAAPVARFQPNVEYPYSRDWNFSIVTRKRSNNYGFINAADYRPEERTPLMALIGDSLIEAGEKSMELARSLQAQGDYPDGALVPLAAVHLLAPLPVPTQIRDASVFPDHIRQAPVGMRRMAAGLAGHPEPELVPEPDVPPVYRDRPIYYLSNRFSVIGPLLAAPPERGQLQKQLQQLAAKKWRHPISGEWSVFGFSSIERFLVQLSIEQRNFRGLGQQVDRVVDEEGVARLPVARLQVPLDGHAGPPRLDAGVGEGRQQAVEVLPVSAEQHPGEERDIVLADDVRRHGGGEGGEGNPRRSGRRAGAGAAERRLEIEHAAGSLSGCGPGEFTGTTRAGGAGFHRRLRIDSPAVLTAG